MHMVVLRRAVYEQDRMIAVRLARGFNAAKQRAFESYDEGSSSLPWINLDLEYAREILGTDVYPYGVKKNLPTLEAATLYSHEQGLTPRRFAVEELFAPETLGLFNDH
jgi:4,5-dihydroxyphthalate decarboxylase